MATLKTTDQKIDLLVEAMQAQHKAITNLQKEFTHQRNDIKTIKTEVGNLKTEFGGLKTEVGGLRNEVGGLKTGVNSLKAEVGGLKKDIQFFRKEMYEQFDSWDKKFFDFKSQIHDLIDNGFSSKAKEHDEAIEILNVRTTEIRADIEKLNNVVFPG